MEGVAKADATQFWERDRQARRMLRLGDRRRAWAPCTGGARSRSRDCGLGGHTDAPDSRPDAQSRADSQKPQASQQRDGSLSQRPAALPVATTHAAAHWHAADFSQRQPSRLSQPRTQRRLPQRPSPARAPPAPLTPARSPRWQSLSFSSCCPSCPRRCPTRPPWWPGPSRRCR